MKHKRWLQENHDEIYQAYLEFVYQDFTGFVRYSLLEEQKFIKENICVTYGELLYPSVKTILKKIRLEEDDCFLDLGSGIGKFILTLYLLSPLKKIIGFEASKSLFDQSVQALLRFGSIPELKSLDRKIILEEGNFLQKDWQGATIVYACATCFTQTLLDEIGEKINQTPSIRQVLSLKPLSTLQRLPFREIFDVECSWDSALCYYYHDF